MTDDVINVAARMKAERTSYGESRGAYAARYGLTPTKVANIEGGRKLKPGEAELIPHLLEPGWQPPPPSEEVKAKTAKAKKPAAAGPTISAPPDTEEDVDPGYDTTLPLTLEMVVERYAEVHARLEGRPSAIPWGQTWGAPGAGPPHDWPLIMRWCGQVERWLDTGELPPRIGSGVLPTSDPTPTSEPVAVIGEPDPPPEDEDELLAEGEQLADVLGVVPTVDLNDGLLRFSNSELRTFKRCRRQWWLAYHRQLGLPNRGRTGAAPLGTRIHRCLAVHYVPPEQTPGDIFDELERTIAEDLAYIGDDEVARAELMKERDLAHAMLEGYLEWLAETGADADIEVAAAESPLEVDPQFGEGLETVRLIGKLDVRVKRHFRDDVTRMFMDHKTVGDLSSPTKMLQFDEQMLHYHLLEFLDLRANPDQIPDTDPNAVRTDGALYNMLRKVKRTPRANPPFYGRVEVHHNIDTLRSYWARVRGEIAEIIAVTARLDAGADPLEVVWPMPTRDCSWQCDYYHVCTMLDDGSRAEDMLATTFVHVSPLQRYHDALNTTASEDA